MGFDPLDILIILQIGKIGRFISSEIIVVNLTLRHFRIIISVMEFIRSVRKFHLLDFEFAFLNKVVIFGLIVFDVLILLFTKLVQVQSGPFLPFLRSVAHLPAVLLLFKLIDFFGLISLFIEVLIVLVCNSILFRVFL